LTEVITRLRFSSLSVEAQKVEVRLEIANQILRKNVGSGHVLEIQSRISLGAY